MKIAVFETEAWERPFFDEPDEEHEVVCVEAPLEREAASDDADADVVSAFVHSDVDAATLDQIENIRAFARGEAQNAAWRG